MTETGPSAGVHGSGTKCKVEELVAQIFRASQASLNIVKIQLHQACAQNYYLKGPT